MPSGCVLSLSELARRAKLPKATAFRLVNQLVVLGALERNGDGYELGVRLFEFGSMVGRQRRLRDEALPFMEDLYEATHETIHLGALDGLEVLYVEKNRRPAEKPRADRRRDPQAALLHRARQGDPLAVPRRPREGGRGSGAESAHSAHDHVVGPTPP